MLVVSALEQTRLTRPHLAEAEQVGQVMDLLVSMASSAIAILADRTTICLGLEPQDIVSITIKTAMA